jgi:uncharacterized protein YbbK (DUF523 family)
MKKPKVGICTCLTGKKVRYDGGHRLDRALLDFLGREAELIAVCPETECGMPSPREPADLHEISGEIRFISRGSGEDLTDRILVWTERKIRELTEEGPDGFVFKAKSPSCALTSAEIFSGAETGNPCRYGPGLFAAEFSKRFPRIPVREAEQLQTPEARESFLKAVLSRGGRRQS